MYLCFIFWFANLYYASTMKNIVLFGVRCFSFLLTDFASQNPSLPSLREATLGSDEATPNGWSNSPEKLIVPPHFWIASSFRFAPLLAKTEETIGFANRPSSRAFSEAIQTVTDFGSLNQNSVLVGLNPDWVD